MKYELGFMANNLTIKIYNSGGKLVNKFEAPTSRGSNDFIFYPIDSRGRPLKNGVYFYKISAESSLGTAKTSGRFVVLR
jgi:flagellar hook assembly protein FlgD